MGNGTRLMWNDMTEPVLLEEYAGVPVPTPRPELPTDVSESVTVPGTRLPGEGDDWEVRAYFTNPKGVAGYYAQPLPAAHTGFKIYRGGQFQYSLDAGPSRGGKDGFGNLRFEGEPADLDKNNRGIASLGEVRIAPPKGVSGEAFARQLGQAAYDYDGSRRYALPPPALPLYEAGASQPSLPLVGNAMAKGDYNSNSFAAGLLGRVGAASNIPAIQQHLANKWAAPGLEQPLPQPYFRRR
jgi:hypothetical protein